MPEDGQTIIYQKKHEPEEQEEPNYSDLQTYFGRAEDEFETTNILVMSNGTIQTVMQEVETMEKILINQVFLAMIDTSKVDEKNGETVPGNPRGATGCGTLCWSNNVSSLFCHKRSPRYKKEKQLLDMIEKNNMKWYGIREEEIEED